MVAQKRRDLKSQAILRLGIKICVIREHTNTLTSFFPQVAAKAKVMHPLVHRDIYVRPVLERVTPTDRLKSCI